MPTTCRALGVAVGTRVLQHFFSLLQLGPSCLLRTLLVSHSEVEAAYSINTYPFCSPFAVQISIQLLSICSSSAVVQQSPCSPSAVLHRSSIASSPIAAAMITSSLAIASSSCTLQRRKVLPAGCNGYSHTSTFTRIHEDRVSCVLHHASYERVELSIQHIRVRVTSISHDRHIPIIARMNHSHDVWAQRHTDSDTSPQQCQHVV